MPSLHKDSRNKSPYWYCAYQTSDGRRHFKSTKSSDKRQARQVCETWAKASILGTKLSSDKARQVIAQGVTDILMASGQTLPSNTSESNIHDDIFKNLRQALNNLAAEVSA
jgi:hypothetical protein